MGGVGGSGRAEGGSRSWGEEGGTPFNLMGYGELK